MAVDKQEEAILYDAFRSGQLSEQDQIDYINAVRTNQIGIPLEAEGAMEVRSAIFGSVEKPSLAVSVGSTVEEAARAVGVGGGVAKAVGGVARDVVENPAETTLSAAVQVVPQLRGLRAAGAVARAGADIVATTVGKEIEQAANLEQDRSIAGSAALSTAEVVGGRALGGAAAKFLPQKIRERIGFELTELGAEDLQRRTRMLSDGGFETVAQAQNNLDTLRERILTTTQETAQGQKPVGVARFKTVAERISQKEQPQFSLLFRENEKARKAVEQAISGGVEDLPKDFSISDNILQTFRGAVEGLNKDIKNVSETLKQPKYRNATFDVEGAYEAAQAMVLESTSIGRQAQKRFIQELNSVMLDKDGSVKQALTLAEKSKLRANLNEALGDFSPTRDFQTPEGGIIGDINRIMDGYLQEGAQGDKILAEAYDLSQQQAAFLGKREAISETNLARRMGLTDLKELRKATTNKAVINLLSKNEVVYRQTRNVLSEYNPDLLEAVNLQLRKDVYENTIAPQTGKVNSAQLSKLLNEKEPVLREAFGNKYVDDLKRSEAILQGTEFLDGFLDKNRLGDGEVLPVEDIIRLGAAYGAGHNLSQASARQNFITKGLRKAFLGNVDDAVIVEKLKSPKLQKMLDEAAHYSMKDPAAYNAYQAITRELGVKPLSQQAYNYLSDGTMTELELASRGILIPVNSGLRLLRLAKQAPAQENTNEQPNP